MQRSLLAVLAIAALAFVGCGGDDGGGGDGVDVDAFQSCLREDLEVQTTDNRIEGADTQPVAIFEIEGASETDFGISVPALVAVFKSEDDAKSAEEGVSDEGTLKADRSGAVVWVFPAVSGVTVDEDAESTFRSCAEEAS